MSARRIGVVALVLLGCGGHWFTPNPTLVLEPAAPVLYAYQGEATSEPSYLGMRGLGVDAFSWTVQPGARVTASPQTGYGGSAWSWTVLTADASGFAAGTHTDSITIVAPECDNSPVTVPVEIVVAASGDPFMRVDPAELTFTMDYLGSAPAPQSVQISNLGTGSFDWTAGTTTSWIGSVLPSSDTCTAETDTVDVTLSPPPDIGMGTYTGWVNLSATGGNPEQRVKVTLTVDVTLGLVAHWELEAGSADDSTGNGHDGTVYGATLAQGRIGDALVFDGADDYVGVAHSASLNSYPITVSVWLKTTDSAFAARGIVNKYIASSYNGYQVYCISGNLHAFYFANSANYIHPGPYGLNGGAVSDGEWHHVAFVVDAASGRLYTDGTLADSSPWTGPPGAPSTGQDLSIGTTPSPENGWFPGFVDDVRIYNRALSLAEVQFLASMGD